MGLEVGSGLGVCLAQQQATRWNYDPSTWARRTDEGWELSDSEGEGYDTGGVPMKGRDPTRG